MKKTTWIARLAAFTVALMMLLGSFPGGYNVTIARSEEEIGVTDDEAARLAAEEEAARKAAEEEAARKAAEEEAARKAAEEEAARKAAEEEAARKAAEEEAARKAAEEEAARKAAEEAAGQAEVSEKIEGEDTDLGNSSDDDFDDSGDFEEFDEFDDFDDFDEFDDGDDDGMIILDDWDAGVVSDELLDRFNNSTNSYEQMEFNGTAKIELQNEGILRAGDEIRLEARVEDVNLSYRLIWEANDRDDRGWYTIASGEKYSYTLTAENVNREYRVVLFSLD